MSKVTGEKCKRNYFGLNYNHDENCVLDCPIHDWWCKIHIGDHNECDCDLEGYHLIDWNYRDIVHEV